MIDRELTMEAIEAARILFDEALSHPCRLDHHGNCQEHFLGNPCQVARLGIALRPFRYGNRDKPPEVRTDCLTPGAVYQTMVRSTFVKVSVQMPFLLNLVPSDAADLEKELHDVFSKVLAPYFLAQKFAQENK